MILYLVDLDDTLANTTSDMRGDPNSVEYLTLVPGAQEFLSECSRRGDLVALVTMGDWRLQMRKVGYLELHFLQSSFLPPSEEASAKKAVFQKIAEMSGVSGTDCIVIGDRIDRELAVGRELGFVTVRMRLEYGKYARQKPKEGTEPNYTVKNFFELMQLPFFLET